MIIILTYLKTFVNISHFFYLLFDLVKDVLIIIILC